MPLTLNVGLSRKLGLPDYGSLGASCNVSVELDGSLVFDDLDRFHERVRQAYVACSQAVCDELARHQEEAGVVNGDGSEPLPSPSNGNAPLKNGHRASEKQLAYVNQLAGQIRGLGARRLETLTKNLYSNPLPELTSLEASGLIDTLKAIKEGRISLDVALNGAPSS